MTGRARSARGVYGISVASELSGVPQQTLRLYERFGLLNPARTAGGTRRYSDDDLDRVKRISELVGRGVNLAGVAHILGLELDNAILQADLTRLQGDCTVLQADNTRLEADYARVETTSTQIAADNARLHAVNARLESDPPDLEAGQSHRDDGLSAPQ
ncbi:MerR family transcriptional regulator [Mycobacterium simiae]|uniref:MerR family transcriptional regulator n=1 Tax=Mycobacterium simiae TaxID=1784 RepID=A0A5B1BNS6_MYCSI|nr:MerR family transcriptional regulator [Mycobacterium simiae]KAA1249455.1 MerR family transcriptional regulator [Mycobacterium simiae]